MATPTTQEMLDAVKIAIYAILTGGAVQSYSINGRNIQKCTLKELRDLESELEEAISDEQGTARNFAGF